MRISDWSSDVCSSDLFAQSVGFPTRVAHGLLCLSLVDGLKNRSEILFDAVASLEWHYKFKKAVFPGDRLMARLRVIEARPTTNPLSGFVRFYLAVVNQSGEVVQVGERSEERRVGKECVRPVKISGT